MWRNAGLMMMRRHFGIDEKVILCSPRKISIGAVRGLPAKRLKHDFSPYLHLRKHSDCVERSIAFNWILFLMLMHVIVGKMSANASHVRPARALSGSRKHKTTAKP